MKQQRNKITVTAKIIYNNLYIFLTITRKREGKKSVINEKVFYTNFKILSWFNIGIEIFKIFGRIEKKVVGWTPDMHLLPYS